MTDFNNGLTEGTNMMVDYLANSEKLIPQDQRWYPDNNNKGDDDVDEKFDTYVSAHNDNKTYDNNTRDNNQTYQSQYNNQSVNNNYSEQNVGTDKNNTKSDTNKFIDEEYEKLSPLEKRLRRLDIMRALGELRDLGCKVTNYNIDDDYYMMKYELDLHRSIRSKRNWLGLYSHMLIGVVKGVELVNNNYNPFDFSLKGLSDEVKADKNTYYEILGDIYEHHNVPGKKMNPWFRLFVTLIGVVVTVGGKQNAHKFIPNRSQEVEDNEDYIEKLRAKAAKDSHSQMSNKQNNQNQQNTQQMNEQNKLDDYMNRQHEQAAQRAKDLEELKRQELEYQKYQQMLAEQKDKFNLMKNNLELTASPKSHRSQSTRSLQKKQNQPINTQINQKSNNSKSSKSSSNKKNNDTMSEMSTSTHNTMDTSKSGISQISINNNLAKKLNQLNNKNTKKNNDITYDQISFGSNKKR
jgi:hypothetical protein